MGCFGERCDESCGDVLVDLLTGKEICLDVQGSLKIEILSLFVLVAFHMGKIDVEGTIGGDVVHCFQLVPVGIEGLIRKWFDILLMAVCAVKNSLIIAK